MGTVPVPGWLGVQGNSRLKWPSSLFGLLLLTGIAVAQGSPPSSSPVDLAAKLKPLTSEERVYLIAKLDDAEVRALLLQYLGQSPAPDRKPDQQQALLSELEQRVTIARANAVAVVKSIMDLPRALVTAHARLSEGVGSPAYFLLLLVLAGFVAAGATAELLFTVATRMLRHNFKAVASKGREGWLRACLAIMLLDSLGIAVFAAGYALAFLAVWQGNEARRQLSAALLIGIIVVRFARCLAEFLFGPDSAGERTLPLTQSGARYFYGSTQRIAFLGVLAVTPAYLLGAWSNDDHVRLLLMILAATVFTAYAVSEVWRGRYHAFDALASSGEPDGNPGWAIRALAYAWAPLVVAYMAAVYASATAMALAGAPIGIARAVAALVIMLVAVPLLDRLVGLAMTARPVRRSLDPASPPGRQNLVQRRVARIVIGVLAVLVVVSLFGLASAASERLGAWLIRLVLDIGVVVLIAYVLRELAIAAINRRLAAENPGGTCGGLDVVRTSRLKTILPLVRRALQACIVVIAALMILSSLGVNIGPLLAGAGVIGVAIGFGSQTLVKDLISGLFFLLDDAFRVGEYIEIGGFGGEVERINVRSLALRTPLGAIHTIPFGGIDAVANYSRDWAIVKMEFRVTYDTDMAKVKKIFRQIGEDLAKDPELAPGFLQPFKFQGVKAMEETGILLRGKFMAIPGTQFQIRKAIFERVQRAFAENEIRFAQRRVQVDLPPGVELDEPTKEAVMNAAAASVAAESLPAR